jgi:predicted ferric reductase
MSRAESAASRLIPSLRMDRSPASAESTLLWSQDQREAIVLAVIVAGALAVVGIWWADTPGRSLHTIGDRLTGAGRITGLVGTYLVLVQVVLMARLPWLDRFIGTDRLSAWHRANGGYTIGLLIAHTVLTVWGYAATDRVSVVHETNVVIRSYPDVLAATVALVLLIAVGVSSVRLARRHLKHETWYFLHLYTYLAIALSFSHQLATGNDFATHAANRALWVVLYAVTTVLLVTFRLVMPARDAIRHRLEVASVVPEGGGAVSVYITGRALDQMAADAGQFFRWRFLTRDGWWQAHPFSLSAAPNSRFFRITAKGVGDHSRALVHLRPGTRVIAEGPYGNFTTRRRTRPKVLLIAGGVGVTPLRALLEELATRPGQLTLIYRASSERDLLFRSEFDNLAKLKGIAVHYVLGRRNKNLGALGPSQLKRLVPDVVMRDVYVCGPPGMMEDVTKSLRAIGLPRAQLHTERFEL